MATYEEKCFVSSPGAMGAILRGNVNDVSRTKCYDDNVDYTTNVNNWLHRTPYYAQRELYKEQRYEKGRSSIWECTRGITFQHGVLESHGWGGSKKEARNRADHGIYEKATGGFKKKNIDMINNLSKRDIPKVQADSEVSKESNQGLAVQSSSKESNTIITRDEGETVAQDNDNISLAEYLSAEKIFNFPELIGRWMPLAALEIHTETKVSDLITTYYLPESLFTAAQCAPNLVPFEAFIYSQLDIEMRFVVNAQRFQCGKVIASVKFDSYQADAMQMTSMSALNRPHVILDLASNNQGVLKIPFRYHRGFVRNVKNDANSKGIRPSKYASVYVQYLSPLRTGAGGATNMFITPFYRFTQSKFAAMSYRVTVQADNEFLVSHKQKNKEQHALNGNIAPIFNLSMNGKRVQMDLAQDVINTAYKSSGLKQVLTKFENMSLQFGSNGNRDKPIDYQTSIFVPRPRMNFGTGKGLSDAQPLRNNPLTLTSTQWIKPYSDEPQSMTQISRIWGLRDTFTWKNDSAPGAELWKSVVDPSIRSYDTEYTGTPTPVEYVCGMYNFWSGSLEYRFDFVSNAFHTGAVMISIEFGRPVIIDADSCSKASTYTKTFHLGEQKSVCVTVPYIYDTIMRRTCSTVFNPNFSNDEQDKPVDQTRYNALGVRPESKTIIRISVVNDLRPIATTTQEIDVLVFMRAGPTFVPHSLKQMSYVLTRESTGTDPFIDSFPRDNYQVTDDRNTRARRSVKEVHEYLNRKPTSKEFAQVSQKYLPKEIRNEWNEVRADKLKYNHIQGPRTPRVQADQGDKEDEDTTADFSSGKTLLKIQTSDVQTSIKDILRRPVLLVYRHTVNSNLTKGESFFLPIMPPSREFNYHVNQGDAFSDLVGQTPQAAIMNLFRFWRGSNRYTIFVHSGNAEPIYITHVPHSGARLIGNQVIGNDLPEGKERPIMGCGLTTEPMLPTINSSTVVEVPYDTENFWTLTFEENTQRNYAWRDKGDTNAGHLVITTTTDTQVTIWWSAGDDFEVANFYGIPECRNRDALMQFPDAHGRVQVDQEFSLSRKQRNKQQHALNGNIAVRIQADEDFQVEEGRTFSSTLSQMKHEIMKLSDPRVLAKAAVGSIPLVGPALTLAPVVATAERLAEDSQKTLKHMNKTMETIDGAASAINQVSLQLAPLVSTINGFFTARNLGSSMSIWAERLIDFVTDLSVAWYQKSWVSVGVTCMKLFAKVLLVNMSGVTEYLSMFTDALMALVGQPRVQAPSNTSTIVGAIAGVVGLAFGVRICQNNYSSYTNQLSRAFFQTSGISYINQVIRFVQTVFDILQQMIMEALGYKSPEAVALKMLSGKNLLLKNFIVSAQSCINEANSNMMLHPRFRTKFWYTVTQAYQIQQVMAMVPTNVVSPQLSKLCSEVIKVGNERMMDLSCSPVRYEPFVISIEGSHGIGKSHLTDKLISHLLTAIGYTRSSSGWTYTRAPGSKHWSGYRDQPAIIYDDWMNLNDAQLMSQQVSELYQLKSTSTFIPEMAHLEEKRIKANPMLVILLTNGAFPSGMANIAHHPQAVFRRRDIVLRANLKAEYEGCDPRALSQDESQMVSHLEFRKYASACDPRSVENSAARGWTETMEYMAKKFQRYHAQEEVNVRARVNILREQMQIGAQECFDFEDPFSLLYRATEFVASEDMGTNAWLPSEQLEAAVNEIVEQIKAKKSENIPIIIPPEPDDIYTQFDCCPTSWTELITHFAKGALITPELWSRIATWGADGLTNILATMTDWSHTPFHGECCVCLEETALAYACTDSDNMHKVCARCWANIVSMSPAVVCPVCRSPNVAVFLEKKDGMLATILCWLATLTKDFFVPALRVVSKFLSLYKSRAMSKLQLITEAILSFSGWGYSRNHLASTLGTLVVAEAVDPNESFYDAIGEMAHTVGHAPIETFARTVFVPALNVMSHEGMHFALGDVDRENRPPIGDRRPPLAPRPAWATADSIIADAQRNVRTQADDDWDDNDTPPRDVEATHRARDPIGQCCLSEAGFQACRQPQVTILPQCYHNLLKDSVDTIIYRESQVVGPAWQVPIEIAGVLEMIMVLDNPCQHNCVWNDEQEHRSFCELYISRRQAQIARAQIQYVGTLQNNPSEFLKSIPRFARPDWANQQILPVDITPTNWWTYLGDSWKEYKNMLIVTGLIAGTMGAVYLTYSQISSWFGSQGNAPTRDINFWPSVQNDPNYNPEHARFIQHANRQIRAVRVPRTQGDNLSDVVEGYICKNYVRIIIGSDTKTRYLTAIGIFNHYAAMPRHYVRLLADAQKEGKSINLAQAAVEWAGSKYTRQLYTFDIKDFTISHVSDIAYFKLPASFKMFKDIRKFLTTQKDIDNYISSEGKIIVAPTRENQIAQVIPIQIKGYQHSEIFEDFDNTEFEAFHVLRYTYSKQGACGSLVCMENHQRPILAMHCAGQGDGVYGVGWGVLLTQESVAQMLPDNIVVQCEEVEHASLETANFIFDEECQLDYIGTVPPVLQPHIPQKTKIERSLLHDKFDFKAMTEPTILSPRDPRHKLPFSPLYYGARKHGMKTIDFTTTQIDRAKEALWSKWISGMEPAVVEPKRLTIEQAIIGFEGNKYYEALSLNTSAGYPWNLGAGTTKEAWIDVDWVSRKCEVKDELFQEIKRKENLRRNGEVPETIFVDTLKDERKKKEKILKAGATRVFCASPVDYTIALRQNLLHFCAAFMKNRHSMMHAVGIDVHGEEWARLWARLTKHGDRFVGLDYSNFGPAFNARIAAAASEIMKRWTLKYIKNDSCTQKEWERELDALGWECDMSVHLCGNTLYRQNCGSPSGASITVIKNSLVNLLYILCAWEALCGELARQDVVDIWQEFKDSVELCVYGDDLVMTVAPKYREIFNMQTIQAWFADYGIVSTDAAKSGDKVLPTVGKQEVTFLKRGWTKHPTRPYQYLAPLDMVSVNDITQWIWKSPDRRMATRVNCESALLEAHGQGPKLYEALRMKINMGLEKLGIDAISMNWYDVDNKYFQTPVEFGSSEIWG
nr:MAG: polyprotein [Iflaviridae sp.]